jgi:hypothetical protein
MTSIRSLIRKCRIEFKNAAKATVLENKNEQATRTTMNAVTIQK